MTNSNDRNKKDTNRPFDALMAELAPFRQSQNRTVADRGAPPISKLWVPHLRYIDPIGLTWSMTGGFRAGIRPPN